MTKLLYQAIGVSNQQSPFDEAILTVANSASVTIVSPYISMGYLERIIRVSSGWRLISDVEAWLGSTTVDERLKVVHFIENHQEKIHHYPALHAKVLVSPHRAYIGSANITHSGILRKIELGLLLDDEGLLVELNQWVDSLWNYASVPELDEVKSHNLVLDKNSQQLNNLGFQRPPNLSTTTRRTRASLKFIGEPGSVAAVSPENESTEDLIQSEGSESYEEPSGSSSVALKPRLDIPKILNDIVDSMAYQGFTLAVLLKTFKSIDPSVAKVEIYRALLHYCSNLSRSVFERDTVNRLTYEAGWFRQSTPIRLDNAQVPWDVFLTALIRVLSFDDFKFQPDVGQLESLSGIKISAQKQALASLALTGVIQQDDEGLLLLNIDFEWSSRFKLFKKSYAAWLEKLDLTKSKAIYVPTQIEVSIPTFPNVPLSNEIYVAGITPNSETDFSKKKTEVAPKKTDELFDLEDLNFSDNLKGFVISESVEHKTLNFKESYTYAQVDTVLNELLTLIRNSGNPFHMNLSGLESYLYKKTKAPRPLCKKICSNEFLGFEHPLRIKLTGKRKMNVSYAEIEGCVLDFFPLTKSNIGLLAPKKVEPLKVAAQAVNIKKSEHTRARADQAYRAIVLDIAQTNGMLDINQMKSLPRRIAEKLSEDEEYIRLLLKGGIPTCHLLFNVFSRNKLFYYVLRRHQLLHYPGTEEIVQLLERSAANQNKLLGWLANPTQNNKAETKSIEHERAVAPSAGKAIDSKERERIKFVRQKADKLYADLLGLVIDFGNPLDLYKTYPTGEKVSTRLSLIQTNLMIIARDVPANVPKLISIEYSESGSSSVRVKFLDKAESLKEYPLTYEALRKTYFLV